MGSSHDLRRSFEPACYIGASDDAGQKETTRSATRRRQHRPTRLCESGRGGSHGCRAEIASRDRTGIQLSIKLARKQDLDRKGVLGKSAPRLARGRRRGHRPGRGRPDPALAHPPSVRIRKRVRHGNQHPAGLAGSWRECGKQDLGRFRVRHSGRTAGLSTCAGPPRRFCGGRRAW